MNSRDKLFSPVAVVAFFILTAFIFGPSNVFLTNMMEFNDLYSELLSYSIPAALIFVVPLCAVLM